MLKIRNSLTSRSQKLFPNKQANSYSVKWNKKKQPTLTIPPKVMIFVLILFIVIFIFIKMNNNKQTIPINPQQLNIAIVILLTKDPGISGGFLDAITSLSISINEANSSHKLTKIALIHSDVTQCIPVLKYFNYSILARDLPITLQDIDNKNYAKELKDSGCCGILELLKLEVWTLKEYDFILAMDADMLLHQNFDNLFAEMSLNNLRNANKLLGDAYNGKYLGWTHGATAAQKQELMNGGFLIVRPNMEHYNAMYALILEGDFRDGTAWKGSGIGWTYGGRTIQGIVPYYYFGVLGKGNQDIEFDRCVYNNMVEMEKCRKYKYQQIVNNHFTWCQKPWYCIYQQQQPLCIQFNKQWWQISRKVEDMLEIKHRPECPNNKYVPIDYTNSHLFSASNK